MLSTKFIGLENMAAWFEIILRFENKKIVQNYKHLHDYFNTSAISTFLRFLLYIEIP